MRCQYLKTYRQQSRKSGSPGSASEEPMSVEEGACFPPAEKDGGASRGRLPQTRIGLSKIISATARLCPQPAPPETQTGIMLWGAREVGLACLPVAQKEEARLKAAPVTCSSRVVSPKTFLAMRRLGCLGLLRHLDGRVRNYWTVDDFVAGPSLQVQQGSTGSNSSAPST